MKRNIILIILILVFNILWLYGISYVNDFIVTKDLRIIIGEQEVKKPEEEYNENSEEKDDYNGENYVTIGKKIETHLEKTSLEGYGEYIAKKSIRNDVNPYLISAIIIVNSNCKIQCNAIVEVCNNVGDLVGSSGGCFGGTYRKYYSLEDGIDDLVEYVAKEFYANDLKTPAAIYKKYKKNVSWSYKVSRYMDKIKKTK